MLPPIITKEETCRNNNTHNITLVIKIEPAVLLVRAHAQDRALAPHQERQVLMAPMALMATAHPTHGYRQ